jgi:hypothetical protein
MPRQKTPTTITVTGMTPFPIDMLRYDACWPASSVDSGKIDASIKRANAEPLEISLTVAAGYSGPTVARWASFGWSVR